MKFSRFNLYLEKYPFEDATLIYNTLTKSTVAIRKDFRNTVIKNLPLDAEDQELITELKNLGIVVEDNLNEDHTFNYWFNKLRFSTIVWNGVILPTTDCDLRCTYCYQGLEKPYSIMSKEVMDKTINFFSERIYKDKPKQIFWMFFGGEPLIHLDCINYTTEKMKQICDKEKVIFQFAITTNGTNLNKEDVKNWINNGLVSLQVTVDGPQHIHDKRRINKDGSGSFDKIMQNIVQCSDLINIVLRVNLDAENKDYIPELLDYLKEKNLQKKLKIFYGLLLEAQQEMEHQKKYKMNENYGGKELLKLRAEAINRGFEVTEILEGGPCIIKSYASVLINPKGNVYKCTGHIGMESSTFGDLGNCDTETRCSIGDYNDEMDKFLLGSLDDNLDLSLENNFSFSAKCAQYVGMQLDRECLDCAVAPICLGGCPYKAYTKFNDDTQKYCEKSYYFSVYKDVLKQMFAEEELKAKLR